MSAPKQIIELIDRFDRNRDAYQSGQYNETQLRREFLDPLFESLGWDIYNKQGYAEAYKDVIHEDAIKIGTATKAPDYCFRIGGTRKFFVEAKKPSINVKEDISPAFQLRRYSWSAKLPLSILTDFEEFAVYDCRIKPIKTDSASTARIKYLTFSDYLQTWDELVSIFSRESVLKGSFDKYVESTKIKKGTAEVDDAFLTEIELWRELLAKNIAIRNPQLTQRELNFTVQRTIDRLIFLRICEDRGIETYGRLMALQNSDRVYPQLCEIFHRADERYNSGLFHFSKEKDRAESPDELSLSLAIDDKPLKEIIKNLYYPDSAYEFSVLPADILGQVYEQFLGKVIRLTAGHRAVVEDKPEVKKAGGVYYTPTYIVEYIVKNTVGKLLENKTPKSVSQLRILDPACGSGSFLINAYQLLLDWHRDFYINEGIAKHKKELYQVAGGDYRLTTAERKRILLNNIYGVDIDPQAVEVTKLSLLLKVLEGENEQTISNQLKLFHERALPDLGNNIKCGNSLIGPDFYDNQQLNFLDDEERYRINVFDWEKEFPEIFQKTPQSRRDAKNSKNTGFDVVIGNPPYIRMEEFKDIKSYLRFEYQTHSDRADIYYYFVEKAVKLLINGGRFGFIISNTFTRSRAGSSLRSFIIANLNLVTLVEFGDFTPFEGATVYPIIIIAEKSETKKNDVGFVLQDRNPLIMPIEEQFSVLFELERSSISEKEWIFDKPKTISLRSRLLSQFPSLREIYGEVRMGIKSGLNEAFIITNMDKEKILSSNSEAQKIIKPYVGGKNLDQWRYRWSEEWIIYTYHDIDISQYPNVLEHLRPFKSELQKRATQQEWYELQQPQEAYSVLFEKPKIIFPDISRYPKFSLDTRHMYFSNTVYFIPSDSLFLLGLLNSKLLWFVIRGLSNALRGGMWRFRLFSGYIERLPIRIINFSDPKDKSLHDRMVELVDRMVSLHKQLVSTKTPDGKTVLQRQIDATDNQIDRLVYELYGLTEEEIKIVEGK